MSLVSLALHRLVAVGMLVALMVFSGVATAQNDSTTSLREAREAAQARDQQRLMGFLDDQQALESALEQARNDYESAQQQHDALEAQQTEQADQASELSERQEIGRASCRERV